MHFTFDLVVFWCYTFMYVFAIGGSFYVFFLYFQFARNFLIILNSNRFYFFMYIAALSGVISRRQIKIRQTQKRHKPDCLTVKIIIYAHCFTRFWVTFAQGSLKFNNFILNLNKNYSKERWPLTGDFYSLLSDFLLLLQWAKIIRLIVCVDSVLTKFE